MLSYGFRLDVGGGYKTANNVKFANKMDIFTTTALPMPAP